MQGCGKLESIPASARRLRTAPRAFCGAAVVAVPDTAAAARPACHAEAPATRRRDLGCVRAGGCSSLCVLPDRAVRCSLPLLSILLSHWNNRGMWPLRRYSKHANTLPPAAPAALMDTCACCCRALIFQLPSPLTSPPPSPLHTPYFPHFPLRAQRGSIFILLKFASLRLKGRAAGGRSQKGVR